MEVNELFKQRSITACMKASYNTVTSDIRSLVQAMDYPCAVCRYCWLSYSTSSSPTSRFTIGES